ncbi:YsnF/AvaK domain-containing protein [Hymenobacter sp. PAMC 26628]|uniref:YsnF/AvaK domain-containing protein n=1 Tax=Hymenobacter sp. PAMC 26628 TaxID=1484118 RepID=UPI00076FE2B4|nr:YsnF/AvaK domain-containing protein [Hymenobacter sp. PAMC 26628]AMJ65256.1 hypothetical protein AXW84_07325 [Hymenobacter sp. PAMC 26628]
MAQTVVGLFNSASEAQQAVQQLTSAGFVRDNVDVAAQQQGGASSAGSGRNNDPSDYQNASGTATEGAVDATARVAGKAEDGIGNFFSNLFGGDDNDDARAYTGVARSGSSVVTVHAATADEAERARDILDQYGAIDVHEQAAAQGYAATGSQQATGGTAEGTQKLNIIEENLQVGKRVEQTGGARIRTRIIERPVEESVRLREEHVNVNRTEVNRPATEADFAAFKEGEISVTEQAERAIVAKEARVVGEVSIDKTATERVETIHDTVRKTDVEVENLGGARTAADNDQNNSTGKL